MIKMIAIGLVVVALLGGGGWYWQDSRDKDDTNSMNQNSQQGVEQSKQESQQEKQETIDDDDADYLVIEEWGVKIPKDVLPENTSYRMATANVAYLYNTDVDKELSKLSEEDSRILDECLKTDARISIIRIPESTINNPDSPEYIREIKKIIGDYGFTITSAQARCPGFKDKPEIEQLVQAYFAEPFRAVRTTAIEAMVTK